MTTAIIGSKDLNTPTELSYSQVKVLAKMNQAELDRLYSRLYNYIGSFGGTQFGIDWPTIRLTWPKLATYMHIARRFYNKRK